MKKILFLALFAAISMQLNGADGEMKALPFYGEEAEEQSSIPTGEVPTQGARQQGQYPVLKRINAMGMEKRAS